MVMVVVMFVIVCSYADLPPPFPADIPNFFTFELPIVSQLWGCGCDAIRPFPAKCCVTLIVSFHCPLYTVTFKVRFFQKYNFR